MISNSIQTTTLGQGNSIGATNPAKHATARLWQLIYLSVSKYDFPEPELRSLLAKARQNNQRLDVTGMLLYRERCFMQVLEGQCSVVESLFKKIGQDPRHEEVSILMSGQIPERSFGDWRMGFVNVHQAQTLPGFTDFFGPEFSLKMFAHNGTFARNTLLTFRDYRWRQDGDGSPLAKRGC
ncbi:BLUF domain-containing protein [Anatilimnocola floriformis]|uniref:BLUF domain-containing protein n=1 Tax=Anatilimnocola floriformis TaxID=2948575 RepID=UPI0020C54DD6|nr:BLUF domain-containing protein [Anatilimnocola floriformis]